MKTIIPVIMGLSLLGGVILYPKPTKSEFDVNSLNEQVQTHEERLNQVEVKDQEQDNRIEQQGTVIEKQQVIIKEVQSQQPVQPVVEPTPEPPKEPIKITAPTKPGVVQNEVDVKSVDTK